MRDAPLIGADYEYFCQEKTGVGSLLSSFVLSPEIWCAFRPAGKVEKDKELSALEGTFAQQYGAVVLRPVFVEKAQESPAPPMEKKTGFLLLAWQIPRQQRAATRTSIS